MLADVAVSDPRDTFLEPVSGKSSLGDSPRGLFRGIPPGVVPWEIPWAGLPGESAGGLPLRLPAPTGLVVLGKNPVNRVRAGAIHRLAVFRPVEKG